MSTDILKAIIGALGVIIGAVATVILKQYFENKDIPTIDFDRQKALTGMWKGLVDVSPTALTQYQVDLILTVDSKKITGTGIIHYPDDEVEVILNGHFRNGSFLRMDYESKNKTIVQFGSFVFRLNGTSTALSGRIVGYGHIAERIIFGTGEFKKVIVH